MATDIKIETPDGTLDIEIKTFKAHSERNHIALSGSSLDWYKLTENTRHLLSQIVSESIQRQFEELQKQEPNQAKITELEDKAFEVLQITRDARNFKSQARMIEIIERYRDFEFAL